MSASTDRRWAEAARELEFTQLTRLRAQAEGWRNGLTGLTGLIVIVTVLKGRDDLGALPSGPRAVAVGLLGGALLLLVAGSLLAVRASFGTPGGRVLLAGRALREWTGKEVVRVRRAVILSAVAFVLGVGLVASALGVAWTTTEDAPGNLVTVTTASFTVCGELASYRPPTVTVWRVSGETRTPTVIRVADIRRMVPAASC